MTKYAKAIYEIVEASRSHMTADQIFETLRKRYPSVVLATVYNNLNKLWEEGYIRKVAVEGQPDRYDRTERHDHLVCKVCGRLVVSAGAGSSHRNHCPNCLSSLHVDIEPGDRESDCGGIMEPVAVWVRKNGEWAIIHRCRRCGALSSNRVAADDNPMKLMSIAMKPVCLPPFPLERIEEMTKLMAGDGSLKF